MPKRESVDYGRLLGFAHVQKALEAKVDFKDKTADARIGAKVGGEACMLSDLREMGLRPAKS